MTNHVSPKKMTVEDSLLNLIGDAGRYIELSMVDPKWAAIVHDIELEDGTRDGCLIHVPGVSVELLLKK